MASKFQVRPFPIERLLIPRQIMVEVSHGYGGLKIMKYQDFTLVIVNQQLCYEHKETKEIIPIARISRIQRLIDSTQVIQETQK